MGWFDVACHRCGLKFKQGLADVDRSQPPPEGYIMNLGGAFGPLSCTKCWHESTAEGFDLTNKADIKRWKKTDWSAAKASDAERAAHEAQKKEAAAQVKAQKVADKNAAKAAKLQIKEDLKKYFAEDFHFPGYPEGFGQDRICSYLLIGDPCVMQAAERMLVPGEKVEKVFVPRDGFGGTWVVFFTDRNVIVGHSKALGLPEADPPIPYTKIERVHFDPGNPFCSLTITQYQGGRPYKLNTSIANLGADGEYIRQWTNYVNMKLDQVRSPSMPVAASAPPPVNSADELRKYAALKADGIITEEEFAAKKKELLGL